MENQCLYQRQWDGQSDATTIYPVEKKITVAHDLDSTRFYRSVVEQSLIFCRKNLNSVSLVWLFILYFINILCHFVSVR